MQKNLRKLALCRETLRTLESPAIGLARGGVLQPALNPNDLLPRSLVCHTRYDCFVTDACTLITLPEPTLTEVTLTF